MGTSSAFDSCLWRSVSQSRRVVPGVVRWISAIALAAVAWHGSQVADAGPQHFGFGFGYLVTIETDQAGQSALSVYEPPLRVKEAPWLLRWRDTSDHYRSVVPNSLAVGDFWPGTMGAKEYVVAWSQEGDGSPTLIVLDPPEVFSTRPWKILARTQLPETPPKAQVVAAAAGDLLGTGQSQYVVLLHADGRDQLKLWSPGPTASDPWRLAATWDLPEHPEPTDNGESNRARGMTVADFWGSGHQYVLIDYGQQSVYYRLPSDTSAGDVSAVNPTTDSDSKSVSRELAVEVIDRHVEESKSPSLVVGCDFLKDGFAYVARIPAEQNRPQVSFRVAPRRSERYRTSWVRPDETFAGAKLDGQAEGEGRQIMSGLLDNAFGRVIAAGGGRIFGYIVAGVDERKEKLWKPWKYQGFDDLEISFAHRTPVYRMGCPKQYQDGQWPWEPDDHYGWPFKDEQVTYEVCLKNNGTETIPAGSVTIEAWVNTPHRNADAVSRGKRQIIPANFKVTLDEPLPPFDPTQPKYATVKIPLKWPFDLEQPAGWTWKRINVRQIGERWLIVRAKYARDENERNDRYELALNSTLFRPVWRFDIDAPPGPTIDGLEGHDDRKINTLAYRAPCVAGDPESKEYNGRKLADAVQCMWERSRTSGGDDVWQRMVFDSYRLADTQSRGGLRKLSRAEDWLFYEAPREGEHWVGLWGEYERFERTDGGSELHETGHLVHRIGDLYHYFVNPINLNPITMGDGSPVQMRTYAWGLDSYCSGHAIIGEPACDLHRYIEGTRIGLGWGWHRMLPEQVRVRVLDRDGQPIAQAPVTMWLHPDNEKFRRGVTGDDGTWNPDLTEGKSVYEPFNLPQYEGRALDALAQVFVVDLPGYSDFTIWGAEDVAAHSRYRLMQASLLNPEQWTWNFRTLYKAGAPKADFRVTAGVQGRQIRLTMDAKPGASYRVYRRWEPTYVYQLLGEAQLEPAEPGGRTQAVFTDDMGAEDWYTSKRYRASYYVTEVVNGTESLPVRIYGIGLANATGLTALESGQLVVAVNAGHAEPFGVLCQGTTPLMEAMKHFRFGHLAAKIVGRPGYPARFYATLLNSDLPGESRYFDVIQLDRPDRRERMYAVLHTTNDIGVRPVRDAKSPTVTVTRSDPDSRLAVQAGDWIRTDDERQVRIVGVEGTTLKLERPLTENGAVDQDLNVSVVFGGGAAGDRAELRELNAPLGLATIGRRGDGDGPRVVIADTGNRRVVVWDEATRYITHWSPPVGAGDFRPVAVAADPKDLQALWVLDRRPDRRSQLFRLRLDKDHLVVSDGYPVPIDVGAGTDAARPEMGLAVAGVPGSSDLVVAVSDASQRSVVELLLPAGREEKPSNRSGDTAAAQAGSAKVLGVHRRAIGTFVGDPELAGPTDVAYLAEDGELRLYATDGADRVVRLR
ncbi:MAG: hypothetical protein U0795_18930 [Pirellulales bacterium]